MAGFGRLQIFMRWINTVMRLSKRKALGRNPLSVCRHPLRKVAIARWQNLLQAWVFPWWEDMPGVIWTAISMDRGRRLNRLFRMASTSHSFPISARRCTTTSTHGMRIQRKKNSGVRCLKKLNLKRRILI